MDKMYEQTFHPRRRTHGKLAQEKCSALLPIRVMQIKTIMRYQ